MSVQHIINQRVDYPASVKYSQDKKMMIVCYFDPEKYIDVRIKHVCVQHK